MKTFTIIQCMLVLLVGIGWGMNLYKLVHLDFKAPYKTEIVRSIGIIPLVGMFTGWMIIGEE